MDRFDFAQTARVKSPDGTWVRYSDVEAREAEIARRLLSDDVLTGFDQDFVKRVWAEDDMPALFDYRRAMTAAIAKAFDA